MKLQLLLADSCCRVTNWLGVWSKKSHAKIIFCPVNQSHWYLSIESGNWSFLYYDIMSQIFLLYYLFENMFNNKQFVGYLDRQQIEFELLKVDFATRFRITDIRRKCKRLHRFLLTQRGPIALISITLWFQAVMGLLLEKWGKEGFCSHIQRTRDLYKEKRDSAVRAAEKWLSGESISAKFIYRQFGSHPGKWSISLHVKKLLETY